MRIRQHRGGLHDAMETMETIAPTREAIAAWAAAALRIECAPADIVVEHAGYDPRIAWDTFYVSVRGHGVIGLCDGTVP